MTLFEHFMEEISGGKAEVGVDDLLEHLATACRECSDTCDEEGDEEASRQWRVRGNGVMQALRFYQAFVSERNA
jgi:hypothetical protein